MIQAGVSTFRGVFFAASVGVSLFFSISGFAQATPRQFVRGHIPKIISRLTPLGRLTETNRLNLAIGLPLRNPGALTNFLRQVSDPASPNYRHYLTPEQFTEQFGPTEKDYESVIHFAQANGLTVTRTHSNRVLLDVNGSVADVEKTFHVAMHIYRRPAENRTFYAPDAEPSLDLATPVLDIGGLNNFARPHPRLKKFAAGNQLTAAPKDGSGPLGYYIGNDFRAAYVPGVPLTGAGQTIALVEFDGYYSNDIASYESLAGLPGVPLTNVFLDGFDGTPTTNGDIEVSLDIEMAISMAPGASKIILYEGNPDNFLPNDVLNQIAVDDSSNQINQISSSWGWNGGPDPTTEQIFQQMIAQGQTFFSASGDSDAYTNGEFEDPNQFVQPTASVNITQVGGTTLLTTNPVSETAWNWGYDSLAGFYVGSSGGISTNPIPVWQTGIDMSQNQGSTAFRNIPDVAMIADNVWVVYGNGQSGSVGGTSCAAPLWAAFTALVNQQAAAYGYMPVGFLNPVFYEIGKSANYSADFHDVTTGDNFWTGSPTNFPAVPGYDLCTGWGTPNGMNLITALATPDALEISPAAGFDSLGAVGGPFMVTSQIFSLTNSGDTPLDWSAGNVPAWLTASTNGGALAPFSSATVTFSLNSAANDLPAGIYNANVAFTNLTTGIAQLRQFTLRPGQSVVQNGGFETGDFSGWTLTGDGFNYNFVDDGSNTRISPHSGNYFAALGEVGFLATLSQTMPTLAGQTYLLSLWLDSPNDKYENPPNEFSAAWNGNTIFDQKNIGRIGWTNLQWIVTAASSSSTLKFDGRNDYYYLGLDDVSLTPVPNPSFRSVSAIDNAVSLTWNSLAGIAYEVETSTNLAPPHWTVLSTNVATGLTLTVTNAIGANPQQFYRIRQLP